MTNRRIHTRIPVAFLVLLLMLLPVLLSLIQRHTVLP
jgi:hypothetical protein